MDQNQEMAAMDEIFGDIAPNHDNPEAIEAMVEDMAAAEDLRLQLAEAMVRLDENRRINETLMREVYRLREMISRNNLEG